MDGAWGGSTLETGGCVGRAPPAEAVTRIPVDVDSSGPLGTLTSPRAREGGPVRIPGGYMGRS
jgi:hypothetical protein